MSALQNYITVNSSTDMSVVMSAISHIIENKDVHKGEESLESCWIHFHRGKSVHVRTSFNEVSDALKEFYKTRG